MKTKLLALPLILTAFVGTSPAHAQGVRVCEIEAENSQMTFTPSSATSGTWTWVYSDRVCLGADGSPATGNLEGGFVGSPCIGMVLTGEANGVITGDLNGQGVGVLHAGPGTGYIAVESVLTLEYFFDCTIARVAALQVHVV